MTQYRIGTRGSTLAMIQTRGVLALLQALDSTADFTIEIIASRGDVDQTTPIQSLGEKGLFTAELERKLLNGQIDLAVHSAKDLPTELAPGLVIGACIERIDPRETLVSQHGETLMTLPPGALVGTSSPRRRFQLSALRNDLRFEEIRGNVDTRIRKIREGQYQASVMAAAGLIRMGLLDEAAEIFSLNSMLPAAGQGALAVQCRQDDLHLLSLLKRINHEPTGRAVSAERLVLQRLNVGCASPLGVLAVENGTQMNLQARLYNITLGEWRRADARGNADDWPKLAENVALVLKRE